jgi:hypothetical protein
MGGRSRFSESLLEVDRITCGDLVAFERASHLRHNQAPSRQLLPETYRARHTLRDTGQALDLTHADPPTTSTSTTDWPSNSSGPDLEPDARRAIVERPRVATMNVDRTERDTSPRASPSS